MANINFKDVSIPESSGLDAYAMSGVFGLFKEVIGLFKGGQDNRHQYRMAALKAETDRVLKQMEIAEANGKKDLGDVKLKIQESSENLGKAQKAHEEKKEGWEEQAKEAEQKAAEAAEEGMSDFGKKLELFEAGINTEAMKGTLACLEQKKALGVPEIPFGELEVFRVPCTVTPTDRPTWPLATPPACPPGANIMPHRIRIQGKPNTSAKVKLHMGGAEGPGTTITVDLDAQGKASCDVQDRSIISHAAIEPRDASLIVDCLLRLQLSATEEVYFGTWRGSPCACTFLKKTGGQEEIAQKCISEAWGYNSTGLPDESFVEVFGHSTAKMEAVPEGSSNLAGLWLVEELIFGLSAFGWVYNHTPLALPTHSVYGIIEAIIKAFMALHHRGKAHTAFHPEAVTIFRQPSAGGEGTVPRAKVRFGSWYDPISLSKASSTSSCTNRGGSFKGAALPASSSEARNAHLHKEFFTSIPTQFRAPGKLPGPKKGVLGQVDDIYSLGLTALTILCRAAPFVPMDPKARLNDPYTFHAEKDRISIPPGCPRELVEAILLICPKGEGERPKAEGAWELWSEAAKAHPAKWEWPVFTVHPHIESIRQK